MTVEQLVKLINEVCGLVEKWAKACIYYTMATHKLALIDWMPALQLLAPPGSGKTELMKVLGRICYRPHWIACYDKMTSATLRNELEKAKKRTALIEEADLYPNRTELERYLINRASTATSALSITQQKATSAGAIRWVTSKLYIPGATIIHDRHGLDDLASERRAIVVNIRKQKRGTFLKPDATQLKNLSLPAFDYGTIPSEFHSPETTGSGLDTWEPLIRIASYLKDDSWLQWVWNEVADFNERLADGNQYELEMTVFKAVIGAFNKNTGMLMVKDPLPLKDVTEIVKEEFPWVKGKTVGTTLRKLGFHKDDFRTIGGNTKLITTAEQLKEIAKEIGYQDDQL
ncbi:MAG TPA: hypothetical protein VMX96_03900 [Dehalococcoidia bacterium]|nr:hypothetical protein [Dehalococcoidia bacterium]